MSTAAQYAVPAPITTQFNQCDTMVAPSMPSPGLMPVPVISTPSAPEYAQMMNSFKAAMKNINEIIDLLDRPMKVMPKLSDCIYALATVRAFKVRCIECDHSLENASETASAWIFSISARLAVVNRDLAQVQERVAGVEQEIVKNLQLIEQNIMTVSKSVASMQDGNMLDGSVGPKREGSQEFTILSWMPIIATALTIAEVSKDDEEVSPADSKALMDLAEGLREYRQKGLRLQAELESVKVTENEIITLQLSLQAIAQFLNPLKINIEHCIRAVRGGFAQSRLTGRVASAIVGMEKAQRAIKSLADSLIVAEEYRGVFVTLSSQDCADLDERIKALPNKEKKEVPVVVPAPVVETPQEVPVVTSSPEVPAIVAPVISEPGPRQESLVPPPISISPVYVSPASPADYKSGLVAPVTPVEFKTTLVSPINGWDLVYVKLVSLGGGNGSKLTTLILRGVHLVKGANGANGTAGSQNVAAPNWEIVSMHLVKPTAVMDGKLQHGTSGSSDQYPKLTYLEPFSQAPSVGAISAIPTPVTSPLPGQEASKGLNNYDSAPSGYPTTTLGAPVSMPDAAVDIIAKNDTPAISGDLLSAIPQDQATDALASTTVDDQYSQSSAASSWVEAAPVPQAPARRTDGYFSETSKNIRLDGNTLQADCLGPDDQTYQSSSLDLNEILGNDNGSFTFRFGGWWMSAQNVSLNGAVLTADLRYSGWGWNNAQSLNLDLHIANDGGVLKLVNTN
ncbi:hypothetical protein FRB94_012253 [Tulasnella sp. JGI-2019a]|nr:hypothetical protein FRB94_012253 [Tulasnella sp. JGI-2019a]